MEAQKFYEASLVEKDLETQIDALNLIKTTMPVVMKSKHYNSNGLLHQKFMTARDDLQLSVTILQELTNQVCKDLIAKSNEED